MPSIFDIFRKSTNTLKNVARDTEIKPLRSSTKTNPSKGLPLEEEWNRYIKGGGKKDRAEWEKEWKKFIGK